MTLRELNIGDKFVSAKEYAKKKDRSIKFKICGPPEFNKHHGSATRRCVNYKEQWIENKSCRMEVIKLPI